MRDETILQSNIVLALATIDPITFWWEITQTCDGISFYRPRTADVFTWQLCSCAVLGTSYVTPFPCLNVQ